MPRSTASRNYHYDSDADSLYDSDASAPSSLGFSRKIPESDNYAPSTNVVSRASSETLASTVASSIHEDSDFFRYAGDLPVVAQEPDYDYEIPALEPYHHEIVDSTVRPSNPSDFARLFPSTNRLSIRHDDFTDDGNMNLRVDTDATYRNRRISMQLFHLRLQNLARREFSLRRYCRDSGREVCSSKRQYVDRSNNDSKRSVADIFRRRGSRTGTTGTKASLTDSAYGSIDGMPRADAQVTGDSDSDRSARSILSSSSGNSSNSNASVSSTTPARPQATDTMKLEFSNYARVDITRRTTRNTHRYEFQWWGNTYEWRRTTDDKNLPGVVCFHLYRSDFPSPLAHIVPETRSPNQVMADAAANGWIPPCHMWISSEDVLREQTDHADVIVATGLMALTDDCIRTTWPSQPKKSTMKQLGGKSVTSLRSNSVPEVMHKANATAYPGYVSPPAGATTGVPHKRFFPRFLQRGKSYADY